MIIFINSEATRKQNGRRSSLSQLDKPTLVRYDPSKIVLWGDSTSNYVTDWLWATGEKLFPVMFGLRPGEFFKHSETSLDSNFKTLYDDQRVCYILKGTFTTHNPETGEVFQAREGEGLYFGPNSWWYGYNFTENEIRVIEFIYHEGTGETKTTQLNVKGGRYDLLEKWPAAAAEIHARDTMKIIRSGDMLHVIEGEKTPTLVSFFSGIGGLTAGTISLLPGKMKEPETHPSEEWLIVIKGRLNVLVGEMDVNRTQRKWYELNELDAFYFPKDTRHQYANMSDGTTKFIFAIAPKYK